MSAPTKKILLVAGVAVAQLALVGVSVAPQLSARATGETYVIEVEPLDPIEPFRGAYVALATPGLDNPAWDAPVGWDEDGEVEREKAPSGRVFVSITEKDGLWVGSDWSTDRPSEGPYIVCRRGGLWSGLDCGLDSFFLPQDRATELEEAMDEVARARREREAWEERRHWDEEKQPTYTEEPEPANTRIVAEIKVDSRGHAAIVDVEERPFTAR